MSKQCLDVQQMQHLQELGLELKDTMLYWIKPLDAVIGIVVGLENDWQLDFIDDKKKKYLKYIPSYTLQDVLDALPEKIKYHGEEYSLMLEKDSVAYVNYVGEAQIQSVICQGKVINKAIPLIDYAYSMLCWAIENGYVETNKNE